MIDVELADYEVEADHLGQLSLTHNTPSYVCDVPGSGWTVADLIRRARGHQTDEHRPVIDEEA